MTSGVGIAAACALLWRPLDIGGEFHRFTQRWDGGLLHGGVHPDAILAHPWGWMPLAFALGLAGAGILTRTRAR